MGRLDVISSVQPTHATSDMAYAEDRLGSERIKGAYAWKALQACVVSARRLVCNAQWLTLLIPQRWKPSHPRL